MKETSQKQPKAPRSRKGPQPKNLAPVADVQGPSGKPAAVREADAMWARYGPALHHVKHDISAEAVEEAWYELGHNPADYAGLDPPFSHSLITVSCLIGNKPWKKFWQAIRKHGLEEIVHKLYYDFYVWGRWVSDEDVECLAVMEEMPYYMGTDLHHGRVELVRTPAVAGGPPSRVGLRALRRMGPWQVIDRAQGHQ